MIQLNNFKLRKNKYNIDKFRDYFYTIAENAVIDFIQDKDSFNIGDYSLTYFDEYVFQTNTYEDCVNTIYFNLNTTNNIKKTDLKIKTEPQIPNYYLNLNNIKNEFFELFTKYCDENTLIWQDDYGINLSFNVLLDDETTTNYYFKFIPTFSFEYNNKPSQLYYYNNYSVVEIISPSTAITNFRLKNAYTNGKFQEMIIIFKNIYQHASKSKDLPSEIFETLLYNVPNEFFVESSKQTLINSLNFLKNNSIKSYVTIDNLQSAFDSKNKSMSAIYARNVISVINKYYQSNN